MYSLIRMHLQVTIIFSCWNGGIYCAILSAYIVLEFRVAHCVNESEISYKTRDLLLFVSWLILAV